MVNSKVAKTFTKLQISIHNNNKLTLALRLLTFQVEKIDHFIESFKYSYILSKFTSSRNLF